MSVVTGVGEGADVESGGGSFAGAAFLLGDADARYLRGVAV
ncbi:hypothetical protein PNP85_00040 [Halobacterium salinarum]|uniref:Uncharacterized protein n=1 Tax=Halobacterium salinarum TaxID=2242 RepID=A0A841HCU8_HALSI|nr:hypothetical protein [Halobacterium salinarum]MBB6090881.1 hypothetical protein [Halobacterium salinarum]MDL0137904.1 hypothetical protein [Halobacterium salinarum]